MIKICKSCREVFDASSEKRLYCSIDCAKKKIPWNLGKRELKTCTVEQCKGRRIAKELCETHYRRWLKHGDINYAIIRFHGEKNTSEWRAWCRLKQKCYNMNHKDYAYYGGRGIQVSGRWTGIDGFINFIKDMGYKPTPLHTLDRKDNDGNYEPGNCRWATRKQQANNRRPRYTVLGTK